MSTASWFVHVQNGVVGPLSSENLVLLLKEHRFHFSDFAWNEGLKSWTRISEIDEFSEYLPDAPKTTLPNGAKPAKKAQEVVRETAREVAPEPVTQVKPAPSASVQAPKVAEKPVEKAVEKPAEKPAEPAVKHMSEEEMRVVRVPLSGKVTIKGGATAKVVNFAVGGVLVATDHILPIGSEFQFTLETDAFGKPLELMGMVVRHSHPDEKKGFAIEFLRVNPAYKRLFEQYVRTWKES